ncbi:MAG TPA: amidohydrolase family protein [Candidatus Rubrimentiphilum sp.]|nr:amidohydrolase family protein [Candidatus Rubrimentiphilum sp.]
MIVVHAKKALVEGEERADFSFAIDNGRIAEIAALGDLRKRYPKAELREHGDDVAIIPGLINGHSHAYQILLRGIGDDLPFARWRSDVLYKIIPQLTPDDIYKTFVTAFKEMLAGGITTVAEFFYLNGAGNSHAEAAIAAAKDTGIRLILARTWMDSPKAPAAFREPIDVAASRTRDLMQKYPDVSIGVAPHSLHGASSEMIRVAADFARDADCKLHIHVAERNSDEVRTLRQMGVLNERVVAIHAIHIDEEEKKMLADAGATVVHNPVTNQYLGDGICDVVGLRDLGVPVGLGTDANVSCSILDEMRSAALLQKLVHKDGGAFSTAAAFTLGTSEGAKALGVDAGRFRVGAFADYAVFDRTRLFRSHSQVTSALVYGAGRESIAQGYIAGRAIKVA